LKLITAVIHPAQLGVVKDFLFRLGIKEFVITDLRPEARHARTREIYRGFELHVELVSPLRIEIAVDDDDESVVIKTIIHGTRAGGERSAWEVRIFIFELENAVQIASGQSGTAAL
jgi:nitrogen regulatory protein PII